MLTLFYSLIFANLTNNNQEIIPSVLCLHTQDNQMAEKIYIAIKQHPDILNLQNKISIWGVGELTEYDFLEREVSKKMKDLKGGNIFILLDSNFIGNEFLYDLLMKEINPKESSVATEESLQNMMHLIIIDACMWDSIEPLHTVIINDFDTIKTFIDLTKSNFYKKYTKTPFKGSDACKNDYIAFAANIITKALKEHAL
jgi:hypothetical protein